MASATMLLDGKYATGFYTGRPRIDYPFAVNGDYTTITIERRWVQSASTFTPGTIGRLQDPSHQDAYLNSESTPEPTSVAGVISTTRIFARVPLQQTVPSSMMISLPTPPAAQRVLNIYNTYGAAWTGGYAYYFGGRVFGDGRMFGALKTVSAEADSGSDKRLTITGHGFTTGQRIVFLNTTTINDTTLGLLLVDNGTDQNHWAFVDANTIDLKGCSITSRWTELSASGSQIAYNEEARPVRCNRVTDFYLPGVTPGITSAADIPLPVYGGDPANFVTTFVAQTGTINYQVGELERWNGGPILQRTTITLNPAAL